MSDPFTPLMLSAYPSVAKALERALRQRQQAPLHRLMQQLEGSDGRLLQFEAMHPESRGFRLIRLGSGAAGDSLITNIHLVRRYGGVWASEPGPLAIYRYPPGTLALDALLGSPARSGVAATEGVKDPNVHLLTLVDAQARRSLALLGQRLPWLSAMPERPAAPEERARYQCALTVVETWARTVSGDRRPDRVVPLDQLGQLTRFDLYDD